MTDKKFTDEEIVKALKRCIECNNRRVAYCDGCLLEKTYPECDTEIEVLCLSLINRQKAEIESLRGVCAEVYKLATELKTDIPEAMAEVRVKAEAEAYAEFAERLKYRFPSFCPTIDQIAKELKENSND